MWADEGFRAIRTAALELERQNSTDKHGKPKGDAGGRQMSG